MVNKGCKPSTNYLKYYYFINMEYSQNLYNLKAGNKMTYDSQEI